MILDGVKICSSGYFRVGFDKYSQNYLLDIEDTLGNDRYYIITEEQYQWFEREPAKLERLVRECTEENCKSSKFYFSTWEKENTYEQNKLMWTDSYISMLWGKERGEIHKKIGKPSKLIENNNNSIEIFEMSSKLEVQVIYEKNICFDVAVEFK